MIHTIPHRPQRLSDLARGSWIAAWLLFGVALLGACGDDAVPKSEGDGVDEVRELVLSGPPVNGSQADFMGSPKASVTDVLRRLESVRRDEDAKGLLLRVGPMAGAWGRTSDLKERIDAVREAGKPVHCHFEVTDSLGYALMASTCDRISMTPAGDLDLVGVAAHLFYARRLLQNIGLRADILQVGRYKGAADPFTLDEMPDETRENIGALLTDLHADLVSAISAGRDMAPDRVSALIDEGPFGSGAALDATLVDDVGYDDEAREHVRRAAGVERVRRVKLRPASEPMGLADFLNALSGETPQAAAEGPRIGLVYLEGNIVDSDEPSMDGAHSGPFVRALRSFADDDDVKALVLRIDSPGGSALASDRMWHAVRRVVAKKPVFVSIGDMAASGGYYVACAGTEILAHDSSIVGSIGVVGGKVVAEELAEDVGVSVEILRRGDHAAWTSPTTAFTDSERQIIQRMMRRTYDRFIRRVAAGRGMDPSAVERVAEGRIMTGRRAIEAGLVDRTGSLWEALSLAREAGGLEADAPIERWPRRKTLLDAVAEGMGGAQPGERTRAMVADMAAAAGPVGEAAMLGPLLFGRERVAVALPFVLDLH